MVAEGTFLTMDNIALESGSFTCSHCGRGSRKGGVQKRVLTRLGNHARSIFLQIVSMPANGDFHYKPSVLGPWDHWYPIQ